MSARGLRAVTLGVGAMTPAASHTARRLRSSCGCRSSLAASLDVFHSALSCTPSRGTVKLLQLSLAEAILLRAQHITPFLSQDAGVSGSSSLQCSTLLRMHLVVQQGGGWPAAKPLQCSRWGFRLHLEVEQDGGLHGADGEVLALLAQAQAEGDHAQRWLPDQLARSLDGVVPLGIRLQLLLDLQTEQVQPRMISTVCRLHKQLGTAQAGWRAIARSAW